MKNDLSKPLQWSPDGKTWLDVTCSPKLRGGGVYLQLGTCTMLMVTNPETSDSLRNKPERRVRPYTFDEAKLLVGKPVVHRAKSEVSLVLGFQARDGGVLYVFDLGSISLQSAISHLTHPDGSPFGVVELA